MCVCVCMVTCMCVCYTSLAILPALTHTPIVTVLVHTYILVMCGLRISINIGKGSGVFGIYLCPEYGYMIRLVLVYCQI